jgi:hypothetical protein
MGYPMPVAIALMGGTIEQRIRVVRGLAETLEKWGKGKKIVVMLIDAPPDMSDNKWVSNDIAQRVVMFHERQKFSEMAVRMSQGDFDYGLIVSIESAYELIAEAMQENNALSAKVSASTLLGSDGNPINRESVLVNQLAGSIMYSRGLVPYLYGARGEFFNGGVWMLGTGEDDAAVVERLIGRDEETGRAISQKVPQGTDTQIRRFMEKAVLDGMDVDYRILPLGQDEVVTELFDNVVAILGGSEDGDTEEQEEQ